MPANNDMCMWPLHLQALVQAYDVLRKPELRRQYDTYGLRGLGNQYASLKEWLAGEGSEDSTSAGELHCVTLMQLLLPLQQATIPFFGVPVTYSQARLPMAPPDECTVSVKQGPLHFLDHRW
jgi:curved DNA-binding protein CbpA